MEMDRTKFLGGSDAAGVVGASRWDTPLSVWAEKTGQYIKPDVESEAAELGKELEDYVAKRFTRKTGKPLVRVGSTFFHPDHNFIGGNVDRVVVGEDAGFEAKTCSAWKSKEWEGEEIPQEYIVQCWHYMMVTGRKKWYIAVLIGNQDFKWKEIHWDEKVIRDLERREVNFWNEFVIPKVMPMQSISKRDTDTLDLLFPEAVDGRVIDLGDATNQLVEILIANKKDLKNLEGIIEQNENELKAQLKDAEEGRTSLYKIAWNNIKWKRFDTKKFEIDYPELSKEYKPEKLIRRFSYKSLEEK